jgi:ketosteroid isomerase-like protein
MSAQVQTPPETEPGQRRALWSVDARAGTAAWTGGVATALLGKMSGDAMLLLEGAPVVRGRADAERLLNAQTSLSGLRVTWEPYRIFVSRDLGLGVTFGSTMLQRGDAAPAFGRYVSVWRRNAAREWELVAHVQNGLFRGGVVAVTGTAGGAAGEPRDPFADADRAFAQMARDSTAPVAFARFSAPDAITFSGPELSIGPATIRGRMTESGGGAASWKWSPIATIAAASGDLGATIGEAEIQPPRGDVFLSKYLTVWQRQADGSLKFIVDAGNARPRPVSTSQASAASTPAVRITFVPSADSFAVSAREYDRIWAEEGPRIVRAMEEMSGLRFISPEYADTSIVANVEERASYSGFRQRPMLLRASYSPSTKRATLVHELGHRLQSGLFHRDEEEHAPLFLWVYDTWVSLYGKQFADSQVVIERRRGERYEKAWTEALALSPAERASRWRAVRDERLATRR